MIDPAEAQRHPILLIVLCAIWAWISLSLILRMWLLHRRAGFLKKSLWSFMLLVPLFGWLMYASFFHPPEYSDNEAPTEHSGAALGGGNE